MKAIDYRNLRTYDAYLQYFSRNFAAVSAIFSIFSLALSASFFLGYCIIFRINIFISFEYSDILRIAVILGSLSVCAFPFLVSLYGTTVIALKSFKYPNMIRMIVLLFPYLLLLSPLLGHIKLLDLSLMIAISIVNYAGFSIFAITIFAYNDDRELSHIRNLFNIVSVILAYSFMSGLILGQEQLHFPSYLYDVELKSNNGEFETYHSVNIVLNLSHFTFLVMGGKMIIVESDLIRSARMSKVRPNSASEGIY